MYKVEVFFKDMVLDGLLGKTKYYAILNEFQESGSPHISLFIWIFNAPILKMKLPTLILLRKQ